MYETTPDRAAPPKMVARSSPRTWFARIGQKADLYSLLWVAIAIASLSAAASTASRKFIWRTTWISMGLSFRWFNHYNGDMTNLIGWKGNDCTCINWHMDPKMGAMLTYQCECGYTFTERYKPGLPRCKICKPTRREKKARDNPPLRKRRSREFNSWSDMMRRCYKYSHKKYYRYGGRGITVCERWHTFANFLEDMGRRPLNTTLDRIDNDGNYSPANCRWATPTEQANNTCNHRKITINGCRLSVTVWAWRYRLTRMLINRRFENGWQSEDLLKPAIFGWRFLLPYYKDDTA